MSRALLIERVLHAGWRYQQAADGGGVSRRTVAKWVQRFRMEGVSGLEDRSSRPRRTPHITAAERVVSIRQLREQHHLPAWAIGQALGVARSTVGAWLRRLGLNRLPAAPPVPIQRYEWPVAGDLLHVDIKPLGRFSQAGHRIHGDRRRRSRRAGWEYVHVAVDDHSRLAYVEVLGDQLGATCAAFLQRATAWLAARCVVPSATTDQAISLGCFARPVPPCTSSIVALACIGRERTARRNASFRPCCANGLRPTLHDVSGASARAAAVAAFL